MLARLVQPSTLNSRRLCGSPVRSEPCSCASVWAPPNLKQPRTRLAANASIRAFFVERQMSLWRTCSVQLSLRRSVREIIDNFKDFTHFQCGHTYRHKYRTILLAKLHFRCRSADATPGDVTGSCLHFYSKKYFFYSRYFLCRNKFYFFKFNIIFILTLMFLV